MPTSNTRLILFRSEHEEFLFLNRKIRDACIEAGRLIDIYGAMPDCDEKMVVRQSIEALQERFSSGQLKEDKERLRFLYLQLQASYPDFLGA